MTTIDSTPTSPQRLDADGADRSVASAATASDDSACSCEQGFRHLEAGRDLTS
jgi:hypothetical protein